MSGITRLYVDIPCGQTARENAGTWQGPGGGGAATIYGGAYVPGSWGIVGFQVNTQMVNVCVSGACQRQEVVTGYTPIWGSLPGSGGWRPKLEGDVNN